jgi:amino acid transporter
MSLDQTGAHSQDPTARADSTSGLKTGQLSFVEVLFQALASAAPGLSVTLAVIVGASFAGASLSLSLVFALVGLLLVASCIGQMAARFPSAGGFYTFVANGLHPAVGTMVAWLYLSVWIVFPSTLFLPFGSFIATTLHSDFGWPEKPVWIVSALVCIALIYFLVGRGAKLSTNASIVLGLIEFAILGALAVTLIVKAGDNNTLSVFTTHYATVDGFVGMSGIIGGMIYAIYGFVGFENVVPLAEEAREPRRSVLRATLLAPLILGVFIIFCTYAATVYFGPSRFSEFTAYNDGAPWFGITQEVWHMGWYVLLFALLNSAIASANGATNAGIRHLFAMGRINLLPSAFARTNPTTGTPIFALRTVLVVSVVLTLGTGLLLDGGPLQAFGFLGTIETCVAILLYALVALACLVYFLRNRSDGFNPLLHVVVPILALAVMIPALMAAIGVGSAIFPFIAPLPAPLNIAGYIAFAWLIAGIVYAAWVWRAHPDRARATETVFVDAADEAVPATGS